jgi:ribosomal protein L11 methylase PrmA
VCWRRRRPSARAPTTARSTRKAAAGNARANGVPLELARVNLREELPQLAPTVIANLTAPLLRIVAGRLAAAEPPRRLLCSGLLLEEADAVAATFAAAGMGERERRVDGDWAAISLAPA